MGARFVLVYVNTPIEVCEARDQKGMYAKARAGVLKGFTGGNDPYEGPGDAEISVSSVDSDASDAATLLLPCLTSARGRKN